MSREIPRFVLDGDPFSPTLSRYRFPLEGATRSILEFAAGTFSRAFRSRREAPRIGRNAARNSLLQAYTLVPATVSIFLSRGFFQPNQFVRVNIISEIVSATRYKLPILINMLAEY